MRKYLPLLVLVSAIAFAAGSSFTPGFEGFDPADYPYPIDDLPLTPAGYAFAIWGLIFIALIASAAYGMMKRANDPVWDATRLPLIMTQTIGAAWVGISVWSPLSATVLIWVMLILTLAALSKAVVSRDLWLLIPVGLLAGWLTAASWVALATSLAGQLASISIVTASWIGLCGALIMALTCLIRLRQSAYAATAIWALVGIIVAGKGSTVFLGIVAIGILALIGATWRTWPQRQNL